MESDILITGNVGGAVEWREHPEYGGRATFALASTPRVRRGGEWVDGETIWYRVTCWRRLAQHVRDSLSKGDAVVVGGRLRLDRWTDEQNRPREAYGVDALWVGFDLRRGTASFERTRLRPDPEEPFESDAEVERLRDAEAALLREPEGSDAERAA